MSSSFSDYPNSDNSSSCSSSSGSSDGRSSVGNVSSSDVGSLVNALEIFQGRCRLFWELSWSWLDFFESRVVES